jgi:hypothetical protein
MAIKRTDMAAALNSLTPNAMWVYFDEDYDSIEWNSEDIVKPTKKEVEAEIKRLSDEAEAERLLAEQTEQAKQAARESALAKLAALGLTQEESKAVIGLD